MSATVYSLRRRLLVWLLAPLVAIGAAALFETYDEALATADAVSDRVLSGSALAIAERVVVGETGSLEVDIPYVALEMLTSAAQDRVFYRVDGPPGTFITGYDELPTIPGLALEESGFGDASFRGEAIRVISLARVASTGAGSIPFVVTVAETTLARTELARALLLRSAIRLSLLIAATAVIAWLAVTFALRPLYRLRDAIATRSPDDLRPIEQPVPKEIRGLVETVNTFMGRLDGALGAMRNFTGNASHQLRTPLTIIRTQLTLAGRAGSIDEARAAAATGDEAVALAERVVAQLLLLAKVDQAASERLRQAGSVDLTALAQGITADRVAQAHAAGVDLGFEGEAPCPIQGDAMLLGEMIRNLVENAIAYAGAGAQATVRLSRSTEGVVLEVEDTGAGIAPAKIQAVRQRFVRGDTEDRPGAGLGLPIVEEIATLFGGRLTLEPGSEGRGLRVRIVFPAGEDQVLTKVR